VDEIFETISIIGSLVGAQTKTAELIDRLRLGLDNIAVAARRFRMRPRVLFEEWMDPLISGIRWVEELIEVAGGQPIFPELRLEHDAARRIIDPAVVPSRDPQVIIASWCGRKVNKKLISERAGWEDVSAVRAGHIYEVKSTYILQPGPAALTEGVKQLHAILSWVNAEDVPDEIAAEERTDPAIQARFGQ
jgi:iron complex transport system substrate-binding protein